MPFSLRWSDRAIRQLRSLDKETARRIVKKIQGLKESPLQKTKPLFGCDFRRLRIGGWRIIVEILFSRKIVKIIMLGKRDSVYKELRMMR